jgi:hypothetical protein
LVKISDWTPSSNYRKYDDHGFLLPDYKHGYEDDPDWVQGWAGMIDGEIEFTPLNSDDVFKFFAEELDEEDEQEAHSQGDAFLAALESYKMETAIQLECSPQEAEWIAMGLSALHEQLPNKLSAHAGRILYLRRQIRQILAELYLTQMRKKNR